MQFVTGNGARIPSLGFGTYGMRGSALSSIVSRALHAGFREHRLHRSAASAPAQQSCLDAVAGERALRFFRHELLLEFAPGRDVGRGRGRCDGTSSQRKRKHPGGGNEISSFHAAPLATKYDAGTMPAQQFHRIFHREELRITPQAVLLVRKSGAVRHGSNA